MNRANLDVCPHPLPPRVPVVPDQTSVTKPIDHTGPETGPDPTQAPGDQLLVDLLEAASHGVDVEEYIACHNTGASHAEIIEAYTANLLTRYALYRGLGATHTELLTATRTSIDLDEALSHLGGNRLAQDTALTVDGPVHDHSYRVGRACGLSHSEILAVHRASVYLLGDNPPQPVLTSTTHPVLGGRITHVHSPLACAGEYCCVHNPSEHPMVTWPQIWRQDKHQMERQCPHGHSHPDPDDPATKTSYGAAHDCDGCCGIDLTT